MVADAERFHGGGSGGVKVMEMKELQHFKERAGGKDPE
jgi:hypothetical protein